MHAIAQNGWRRGRPVLAGISLGFICVMVLSALFCYQLAKYIPALTSVLKYVGAAYIVYLAIRVMRSRPDGGSHKPMTFLNAFLLQFVNVKIILYAITVYTGYVLVRQSGLPVLLLHAGMLSVIGLSGNFAWAVAGGTFQRLLTKYYRPFNISMALVLLWSAAKLVLAN